jgi:hypothetical protein
MAIIERQQKMASPSSLAKVINTNNKRQEQKMSQWLLRAFQSRRVGGF